MSKRCLHCGAWLQDGEMVRLKPEELHYPYGKSGLPYEMVRFVCPGCSAPQTRLITIWDAKHLAKRQIVLVAASR